MYNWAKTVLYREPITYITNKVRDEVEKKMINKENMRPQLLKAIQHKNIYHDTWQTRFGTNLERLLQQV